MPRNSKTEKVSNEQTVAQPVVEKVAEAAPVDVKKPKATKKAKVEKVAEVAPIVSSTTTKVEEVVAAPTNATAEVKTKKQRAKKADKVVETAPIEVNEVEQKDDEPQEELSPSGKKIRYFKCIYGVGEGDNENKFGRFCGYKPKQAAGKALTSILKVKSKNNENLFENVEFSMIECTRGRPHKVSKYTGKRVALENPIVVKIKTGDGQEKEIKYHFQNKVSKVKAEKPVKAAKVDKKDGKKKVKKSAKSKKAKKTSSTKKETTQTQ